MSEDKLAESLVDFCNAVESAVVSLRRQIQGLAETESKATIPEETFQILKWQDEKGEKLGSFQVAYGNQNLPDKWNHAFAVLKANNSVIANPFAVYGYGFRYWIFPGKYDDRIFRKRLSEVKP